MATTILHQRVRRLEQLQGECSLCGGEGKVVVEYSHPDMAELHAAHSIQRDDHGCPRCGRKLLLRVNYVKEMLIRR